MLRDHRHGSGESSRKLRPVFPSIAVKLRGFVFCPCIMLLTCEVSHIQDTHGHTIHIDMRMQVCNAQKERATILYLGGTLGWQQRCTLRILHVHRV